MNENEIDKSHTTIIIEEGSNDKNIASTPRHPRWTRQETFVLIQGKRIAEEQVLEKRRKCPSRIGSDRIEPKWDLVSSYCKGQGVDRGPVQCRKRWSNLLVDFKKVKTWDSEKNEIEGGSSYWTMRSDSRRERKLPGFFDRAVFDVLDGKEVNADVFPLSIVTVMEDGIKVEEDHNGDDDDEENEDVFYSSGNDTVEETEGSLENERKNPPQKIISPLPISVEKPYQPSCRGYSYPDKTKEEQSSPNLWTPGTTPVEEGWKRRRLSFNGCEDANMNERLIKVLEKNSNMINAQLEAQNLNSQLDRDQKKDHTNSLVSALSKLTDAIARIAENLEPKNT